jgi:RNA polymerase sigma-70 factor (ECF subfamily)
MSSAALVPSLFETSPTSVVRRRFLSVCPAPTPPASAATAAAPSGAEKVASVPPAPSVARLHAPGLHALPAAAPANAVAPALASEVVAAEPTERSDVDYRDELIAMLPSLERRALRWCRDAAEAQDLAQDTLLRALHSSPTFDSQGHLRAWLFTVLRNLFISRRRRDQSWQRASAELVTTSLRDEAPHAGFLMSSVERALASLPEGFARVVRLVDLEDYSYADAAGILGVPVGTVMSRLFRACRRLAKELPELA